MHPFPRRTGHRPIFKSAAEAGVLVSASLAAGLLASVAFAQTADHADHAQPVGEAELVSQPEQIEPAARPPDPNHPRMLEQRRRIETHRRAARAMSVGAPPAPAGVQVPVDMRQRRRLAKPPERRAAPAEPRARAAAAATAAAVPPVPPPACPNALPYPGNLPPVKTASLIRAFPDLTWHICITDMGRKGLWIGPVELQRGNAGPWMPVIYQAGLADIFVPYHLDTNFRPYDLRWTTDLSPVSVQDMGLYGFQLWLTNDPYPTVIYEMRERGVGWLCKGDISVQTRRAQELVIWGVSDAGNYDNIIEYGFRDDGTITFRMGNTGYNSPGNPVEAHTHNALWYVDMDLNGWPGDSAYTLAHKEPAPPSFPLTAQDPRTPFSIEGRRQWLPNQLTSLLVEDNAVNAFGNRLGYEFSPLQNALTRHYGWKESWTRSDIYVTRYNFNDTLWASPVTGWLPPDDYLLPALNSQPTLNQDLVAWIKTAAHHVPTDEDRAASNAASGGHSGITLTHWSGFQIQPHNLFNANPLGAPERCGT